MSNSRREKEEAYQMLAEIYGGFTEVFDAVDWREAKALLLEERTEEMPVLTCVKDRDIHGLEKMIHIPFKQRCSINGGSTILEGCSLALLARDRQIPSLDRWIWRSSLSRVLRVGPTIQQHLTGTPPDVTSIELTP